MHKCLLNIQGLEVSKFEFQSRYYIHFWTNTLGKVRALISPHLWLISKVADLSRG